MQKSEWVKLVEFIVALLLRAMEPNLVADKDDSEPSKLPTGVRATPTMHTSATIPRKRKQIKLRSNRNMTSIKMRLHVKVLPHGPYIYINLSRSTFFNSIVMLACSFNKLAKNHFSYHATQKPKVLSKLNCLPD